MPFWKPGGSKREAPEAQAKSDFRPCFGGIAFGGFRCIPAENKTHGMTRARKEASSPCTACSNAATRIDTCRRLRGFPSFQGNGSMEIETRCLSWDGTPSGPQARRLPFPSGQKCGDICHNAYRLKSANRQIGVWRIYAVIANQSADWCGNPPDFPPSPHPSAKAVILSERSESKDLRTERN